MGDESKQRANKSGVPLPPSVKHKFETAFGKDLSDVRIHIGHDATLAAGATGAKSYSSGNDIYFSPGTYQPHSEEGQRMLAHELAHVVQQVAGNQSQNRTETVNKHEQ